MVSTLDRRLTVKATALATRISCLAAALLPLAAVSSESDLAFDPATRAPAQMSDLDLREKVRGYGQSLNALATNPSSALRNAQLQADFADIRWQIDRAIDARQPLEALAEHGLVASDEGAYAIDVDRHPLWWPLRARAKMYFAGDSNERAFEQLLERGFRDSDIEALRKYLASHPAPDSFDSVAANQGITRDFARQVQSSGAVERSALLSYLYQRHRNLAEGSRRWALGLFDTLDQDRVQVLESVLMNWRGTVVKIAPSVDLESELQHIERFLLTLDIADSTSTKEAHR